MHILNPSGTSLSLVCREDREKGEQSKEEKGGNKEGNLDSQASKPPGKDNIVIVSTSTSKKSLIHDL